MEKVLYLIKLKKEKVKEYEKFHIEASPELLNTLKYCGFLNEYIFIFKDYSLVFLEAESVSKSFEKFLKTNIVKKTKVIADSMVEDSQEFFKEEKIIGLKKVFDLQEQLEVLKEHKKILSE